MAKIYLRQKAIPNYDTDPKASRAKFIIQQKKTKCLHCGKSLHQGDYIVYTELSNSAVIWWCSAHTISDHEENL